MAPSRPPSPAVPVETELQRRRAAGFIPFTELAETLARLRATVRHVALNPQGEIVIVVDREER